MVRRYPKLLANIIVFIFDEWEGAWTGFLGRTAIAVTFVRDDDVPLMQKYQNAA